jgi:hypothetical protein
LCIYYRLEGIKEHPLKGLQRFRFWETVLKQYCAKSLHDMHGGDPLGFYKKYVYIDSIWYFQSVE